MPQAAILLLGFIVYMCLTFIPAARNTLRWWNWRCRLELLGATTS
jgi:hypothetical protein